MIYYKYKVKTNVFHWFHLCSLICLLTANGDVSNRKLNMAPLKGKYLLMVSNLLLLWMSANLVTVGAGEDHGLKCWYELDGNPPLKSLDCETKQTLVAGEASRKRRATPHNVTSPRYCMVFRYFEEFSIGDMGGGEDETAKTSKAIFSCDFTNMCQDKAMQKSYDAQYQDHSGSVVCCNTDNCNVHRLEYLTRKCYNADHEHGKSPGKGGAVPVSTQYTACVKITEKRVKMDTTDILRETFSADETSLCPLKNLTNVQNQACSTTWDNKTNVETETCCCYQDRCFIPGWLEDKSAIPHHVSNVSEAQSGPWKQVLYVGIGIAFVTVLTFFIIVAVKCYHRSKYTNSSKPYSKMAYHSMHGDGFEPEGDNVQMLTAINHNTTTTTEEQV